MSKNNDIIKRNILMASKKKKDIVGQPMREVARSIQKPITIPDKIKYLEQKVEKIDLQNSPFQEQILHEMKKIREELHELKQGLRNSSLKRSKTHQSMHEDEEENIYGINHNDDNKNIPSRPHIEQQLHNNIRQQQVSPGRSDRNSNSKPEDIAKSRKFEDSFKGSNRYNKQLLPLNVIQPYLKDYKLQGDIAPQYYGYHKKTSKKVVVKYSNDPAVVEAQAEVYSRLWKNIVKARWPCINKIFEVPEPDVNVLILERNRSGIRELPFEKVLVDIIKILEFIHECGYLYRNIQPEHFMLTEEAKLVVIDFKQARRYTDVKGNHIEVVASQYRQGDFGSNNQLRFMPEGRKDDLQSLGYFALFLMNGQLPWQGFTREQMIKSRTSLTLQQLYKKHPKWLEFMTLINKMTKSERPDYNRLISILQSH